MHILPQLWVSMTPCFVSVIFFPMAVFPQFPKSVLRWSLLQDFVEITFAKWKALPSTGNYFSKKSEALGIIFLRMSSSAWWWIKWLCRNMAIPGSPKLLPHAPLLLNLPWYSIWLTGPSLVQLTECQMHVFCLTQGTSLYLGLHSKI